MIPFLFYLATVPAALFGLAFGVVGAAVVWAVFGFLRRAESPSAFSLNDLVGQRDQ